MSTPEKVESTPEKVELARARLSEERAGKRREEEDERSRISNLRAEGMPSARERQADLYDELKKIGLIRMVEELTGEPLRSPRPTPPDDWNEAMKKRKEEMERMTPRQRKALERRFRVSFDKALRRKPWTAEIPQPSMDDKGVWDTSLTILINEGVASDDFPRTAIIQYHDPSRRLLIEGRGATFWGPIPKGKEGLEKIEDAFVEALADPYIPTYRKPNVHPHTHLPSDQRLKR